jgi:hypothetical protein
MSGYFGVSVPGNFRILIAIVRVRISSEEFLTRACRGLIDALLIDQQFNLDV